MRRLWPVLVVVGLLAAACSSGGELSVEIVEMADPDTEEFTFTASGEAVDDGVVCDSGSWVWTGNRGADGEPMDDAAMGAMFEAGEPFTLIVGHDYVCDDGSGSFVLDAAVELDPNLDPPDVSATWEINGGTNTYESLKGSGDISEDDPSTDQSTYIGTVSGG
jgi:hypothetical protein